MEIRIAVPSDIPQIQYVRNAVKENMLSNPALVTDQDCEEYMTKRGRAWVCESGNQIVGFGYADLKENSIWALFVLPGFERKGIGKKILHMMLEWLFSITKETVWLSTDPDTRAAEFYRMQGWTESGMKRKEIRFEMTYENWQARNAIQSI